MVSNLLYRKNNRPYLRIAHYNQKYGVQAFLVIDRLVDGLSAGGLRVKKGTTSQELAALAKNMTDKQAIAGIKVGGAKAGIDMQPDAPYRAEAIKDFLLAIKPIIINCFSVGPDMNTNLRELESIAKTIGIPSLKIAVGKNKELQPEEFLSRYQLLETKVGEKTVNQLRAAKGVYSATLSLLQILGVKTGDAKIAIQGAGNLGEPLAQLLDEIGVKVVGWSDERKCLMDENGLDVKAILEVKKGNRLPELPDVQGTPNQELFFLDADVLILAAISNSIPQDMVSKIKVKGIVEAANLALSHEIEEEFHHRKVLVVPDVVAGVGGSIAVQSLYDCHPQSGKEILDFVEARVKSLTVDLLDTSLQEGTSPRQMINQKLREIIGE